MPVRRLGSSRVESVDPTPPLVGGDADLTSELFCFRRLRTHNKIIISNTIAATPPMTPPTIGPVAGESLD